MKKRVVFVIALAFSALTGCGYKAPTTNYNKVKTAFNGVEKSLKKPTPVKKLVFASALQPKFKNVDGGLNSIYSVFTENDIQGHDLNDLEYNQPPMIQFRYLKSVFDKIGSGFEFGTKYYDNITGEMYLDIDTGYKAQEQDQYKYNYDFELAIDIDINSDDLINADVAFDVTLSKDNKSYNSKWYVNLVLDYDMANSSPNYTLTLLTENDERQLPYYNRFTYEYDYVEVKNSKINEWRKFCDDSSVRLVKDAAHDSFEKYVDEGITYKVDYPKWFKDGDYYKPTRMLKDKQIVVGNAMFEMGVNATDINPEPFFNKTGTRNEVIKTIYSDFAKVRGEDIVYDIMCREEDNHNQNTATVASIRAMNMDGTGGAENYGLGDVTLRDIFINGYDDNGDRNLVTLWYADINGTTLDKITDIESLTFTFKAGNNVVEATLGDKISTLFQKVRDTYQVSISSANFEIGFTDSLYNVSGTFLGNYIGELDTDTYTPPTFPQDLTNIGVPSYEGQRMDFRYERNGENYFLYITNSNETEAEAYKQKLMKSDYVYDDLAVVSTKNTFIFKKHKNDDFDYILMLSYYDPSYIIIKVWEEERIDGGGNSGNTGGEEDRITSLNLVGDFNSWSTNDPAYSFDSFGPEVFRFNNVLVHRGQRFKVVANNGWEIANPNSTYGGFGCDDFINIAEFTDFFKSDGSADGNIEVLCSCIFSIDAVVREQTIEFNIAKVGAIS